MRFQPPSRNPMGRTCAHMLPLALILMPYALVRYAIDRRKPVRLFCATCAAGEGVEHAPWCHREGLMRR